MLSQQTGMPPAMLMGYNDWPSMVAAARQYLQTVGPQYQRLQQLQQQVERLTRGQVPAQYYPQPGGAGRVGGPSTYAQRLKSGQPLPSAAEIDRLTAQYLR
jgi:hypothetical protein